jgi:hypothetical protein
MILNMTIESISDGEFCEIRGRLKLRIATDEHIYEEWDLE